MSALEATKRTLQQNSKTFQDFQNKHTNPLWCSLVFALLLLLLLLLIFCLRFCLLVCLLFLYIPGTQLKLLNIKQMKY